ncbi:MAG: class I SAM-dependent methyltransferase [Cyanobacteria bacterium J06600_6]
MAEAKIEFDRERANQYDSDIRQAIPGYEALHAMTHSLLQNSLNKSARLLVVGSGTGMELVSYSQQNSGWSLTGVDPALEMMEIARSELKSRSLQDRVTLHDGYVDSLPKTEPMDAATLLLVMHFLDDNGSKLKLLEDIAQRLKPGAKLILADLHGDRSDRYFKQFTQAWQSLYFSRLDDDLKAQAQGNFEASIENSIYFVPEARIIELLQLAGFTKVSKFYHAFLFGGWIAEYGDR